MPGGDRTGPAGMGPMTGRAAGFCAGYPATGYAGFAFGRGGFGQGRSGGRGRRNWFYATGLTGRQRGGYGYPQYADMSYGMPYNPPYAPPANELDALKGQAEYLGNALDDIKKRIEELEKGAGTP